MLLTLSTTHAPATELGYLLGKNPARTQSFELSFGRAHVFYPEASDERCTAALLLDVDPVGLVRRPRGEAAGALTQYVNDRPYVASSLLCVAIGRVFQAALAGRCRERPELAEAALPLVARLAVVPCRGGEALARDLFTPLGYEVTAERHVLDAAHPGWGDSVHLTLTLTGTVRLASLLRHLTVLIPVLDDDKHYFVGDDELEKLLARGDGWLSDHPQRELIATRYLKHQRSLVRAALERLAEDGEAPAAGPTGRDEEALEAPLTLHEQRIAAVVAALQRRGATRVVDLGCGEGKLLRALLREPAFAAIVGVDVSAQALERARARLRLDELDEAARARVTLLQGSLTYRDARIEGFDAACLIEVIEHVDATRLGAVEQAVFAAARPGLVIVTTPNVEYNVRFPSLPAGALRHRDHRFEWTRAAFESWARGVAARTGYEVEFAPIGPEDPEVGAPTQMGVFHR
ncbi:MAG: 3' terminal RNA ribose 2'-O-methyltransferase Hen1 [Myxococcales bacterium]|nr:3' terminal RNA ribose 2'-O-methyltransferase Hen1 [Myxococcales bacterium]